MYRIKENPTVYGNLVIPGYATVEKVEFEESCPPYFRDTILLDELDKSFKQYRTLNSVVEINSDLYRISVYKSLIESHELIERITLVVTLIVILFIFFIYLLNRFFFRRVWSDFFVTLDTLKSFDVNKSSNVQFSNSDISEFELLNDTLNRMIGKIHKDYFNVKEFTGNISHEIQTPLTIIRLKCELLLQSASLTKNQIDLIRDIQKTNSRLSKLNKTLVLLTKIENKQFKQKEKISLDKDIKRHLESFNSLIKAREIKLNYEMKTDVSVLMDPILADVLIVNLIKNAVTHNIDNGKIIIELKESRLIVSNTGEEIDLSSKNIFDRYKKVNKTKGSLGLGLSLIKNTCDIYGYAVSYNYTNDMHIFSILFKPE